MWSRLADYYRSEKTVIGFNLFAEPGREIGYAYNDTDPYSNNGRACQKVSETLFQPRHLYRDVIDVIHDKAPDKIVIFEGFSGYVIRYLPQGATEFIYVENPARPNTIWGRTLYQSWNWSRSLYTDVVYGQWKIPYMVTEFGIKSEVVAQPKPEDLTWLEDACKRFAENGFSWVYWGFGPGKDDYNLVDEDGSVSPAVSILSSYVFTP
jgi:hypothetical protein